MPLKPIVQKLDDVDEKHRDLYAPETDAEGNSTGNFIVSIAAENGYELRNTDALLNALNSERENNKQLKGQLSHFDGVDPAKYKSSLDELEKLRASNPNKQKVDEMVEERITPYKEEINRQLESYKGEATKQLDEKDQTINRLNGQLEKTLVNDFAMSIANKVSSSPGLLAPHLTKFVKADLEGDVARSVIVDANGNPRFSREDINKPMSETEWVEEIKKNPDFAPLIKSEGKPGTGSPQPNGGTPHPGAMKYSDAKTPQQKVEILRQRLQAKGG